MWLLYNSIGIIGLIVHPGPSPSKRVRHDQVAVARQRIAALSVYLIDGPVMASAPEDSAGGGDAEKLGLASPPQSPSNSGIGQWSSRLVRPFTVLHGGSSRGQPAKPTAWLDGLRGFAAFIVYWHHHQLWAHLGNYMNIVLENSWGYEGKYHFATFHFVRTFFCGGHYAVATFFVISGYVLSYKPLSLIQSGDHERLSEIMTSALFRRWFRLFIPVFVTSFVWQTSWHAFGLWTAPFEPQQNYWEELSKWYEDVRSYSQLFRGPGRWAWLYSNIHTWSIPYEFEGSIVTYTTLLALSGATKTARLLVQCTLIFYFMWIVDGWWISMFIAGMLICDLDLLAAKNELPGFLEQLEPYKTLIYVPLFIISLYLGGVPATNNDYEILKNSPGWVYLSVLKPKANVQPKWFYLFWAAVFLVSAVPRLPWLKTLFNSPFCQYLGRISYALYLMHGPVIWTLGDKIYLLVGWPKDPAYFNDPPAWFDLLHLSKAGPLGLEIAFLLPQLILLPATLWVAGLVTRYVDETSVRFAKWLHLQTMPDQDATPGPKSVSGETG